MANVISVSVGRRSSDEVLSDRVVTLPPHNQSSWTGGGYAQFSSTLPPAGYTNVSVQYWNSVRLGSGSLGPFGHV